MWFGYEGNASQALVPVPVERVSEIREMNSAGKVPDDLLETGTYHKTDQLKYTDGAGQESIHRFDSGSGRKKRKKRKQRPPRNQPRPS